jgi:uncharacterized protein (TIGR03663 family)
VICPKCGGDNPANNRFCDTCGAKLLAKDNKEKKKEALPVSSQSQMPPRPSAVASLSGSVIPEALVQWLSLENLIWIGLFITAFFLRFYALGDKPLHHDESLHAFYSWELFKGHGYAYNPMMHGPFQFHGNAFMYFLFGASNTTCRFLAASCSMFSLVLVYLMRPYLGRVGALFAGVMMTLSPSFTYFGRFTREDMYYATFTLMMAYALMGYLSTRRAGYLYFGAAGLALAFCTKEVVYITGYIFVFALVFRWLWEKANPQPGETHLTDALNGLSKNRVPLWIAVGVFLGIMVLLYTTFFTNPNGIIDAFTKSLTYWLGQHEVERGSQPVYFYAALLPFYETISVVGTLVALVYYGFIRDASNRLWRLLGYVVLGSAWWIFVLMGHQTSGLIFSLLLVTLGTGLLAYYSYSPKNLWATFLIVWSLCSFSDMSFAGERMPWLILHSLLPMLLLTGLLLNDLWESWPRQRGWLLAVVAVFCMMLLHNTTNLVFYDKSANPAEQLVYVQSSPDVTQVVSQLTNMSKRLNGNLEMKITCEDYCSWPFAWYLRDFKFVGYPKFTSSQPEGSIEKNPVIITGVEMAAPGHDDRVAQLLASDYVAQRYKLRVWWAPDSAAFFNDTLGGKMDKIWKLFIYREPWSGLGSYDMIVYVRKDVANLYWSNAQ